MALIDTSSFEHNVLVTEIDKVDKIPKKVSFANQKGNIVKCYKYRVRKQRNEESNQ